MASSQVFSSVGRCCARQFGCFVKRPAGRAGWPGSRGFSGADCALLAEELAATENACAAARLLAARRAVDTGAHRDRGFSDGAAWLARQSGTTGSRARQDLDTAKHLDEHPETKEALVAGEISLTQAQEIAQTPGAESDLVALARGGDLSQLRDAARQYRQSQVDAAELRRRQFALREFRHWADRDGMIRFAGALPPEVGLPLARRVETVAARLHRAAKRAANRNGGRVERFDAYAADALVELALVGTSGGTSGEIAGAGGRAGRLNVDLVLVCDLNAWLRGHALPGEACHILGAGPIPVEVARQLSDEPFLKAVIHDGTDILSVKHFGRHIPAALRTAIDLGPPPRFAGRSCARCGRAFGLQGDHEDPVANGGATEKSNLQDLCYPCHLEKTEQDRKAGRLGHNPPTRQQIKRRRRPPPANTSDRPRRHGTKIR